MMVLWAALCAAEPIAGVVVRPFSRADLVWVDENRTSGEGVGEFDGVVRPGIQAYFGAWTGRRIGIVGSLGVAHLSTRTFIGDTVARRAHTVVRPQIDGRYRLRTDQPEVWTSASLHVDIPSAIDRSDAFTDDEQQAADDAARGTRARLGGVGGALGVGVEAQLHPLLSVGLQARLQLHRGTLRDTTAVTASTYISTDTGLLFTIRWPHPQSDSVAIDPDKTP